MNTMLAIAFVAGVHAETDPSDGSLQEQAAQ